MKRSPLSGVTRGVRFSRTIRRPRQRGSGLGLAQTLDFRQQTLEVRVRRFVRKPLGGSELCRCAPRQLGQIRDMAAGVG